MAPIFWIRILNPDSDSGFWIRNLILKPDSGLGIWIQNSESGFWNRILNLDSEFGFRIRIQNPDSESDHLNRICSFFFFQKFCNLCNKFIRCWDCWDFVALIKIKTRINTKSILKNQAVRKRTNTKTRIKFYTKRAFPTLQHT